MLNGELTPPPPPLQSTRLDLSNNMNLQSFVQMFLFLLKLLLQALYFHLQLDVLQQTRCSASSDDCVFMSAVEHYLLFQQQINRKQLFMSNKIAKRLKSVQLNRHSHFRRTRFFQSKQILTLFWV